MNEQSIRKCVDDFNKFIEFNEIEKPTLSAVAEVFGKKDSYRLNSLLENQKPVSAPNYNQDQYPMIDLMFDLALHGKLYYKGNNAKGKLVLIRTPRLDSYLELNSFEKYAFLLQTYWTMYEFTKKFTRWLYIDSFYNFLIGIANAKPAQEILKNEKHQTNCIYFEAAAFQYHLKFFGMGEPELIVREKWIYDDSIRAFSPTPFGIEVARFLCTEALACWNWHHHDVLRLLNFGKKPGKKSNMSNRIEMEKERIIEMKNDSFEIFKKIFPEGIVVNTVKEYDTEIIDGVYCFKVSLSKTVWRKIKMSGKHTLGDLHDEIQWAFDFDHDHLYAFYLGGNQKTGKPIYCADTHDGGTTAEELTIQEIGLSIGQKMIYLFDFGDCWKFTVELIGIEREAPLPLKPMIVEEKGKSPPQYRYVDEDEDEDE